jgi:alkanesulfonate monooxygenase SsuD/methylene tetrahydromethanopterin reductase-like flavin-dependent oxidoreductase (luciferase family)
MANRLKAGLLLPHFGEHASIEKCIEGARRAEAYGFDSVWVRDHLVFRPHALEGADNTHVEGLLLLSAVAAATTRLTIGTAMAICHRHPIHLAQSFAALSHIAGGRLIMGMSIGGFPHEFAAAGLPSDIPSRAALAKINVQLCRRLWAGEKVSCNDAYYHFDQVRLKPVPLRPIPIWGGGSTPAACRRMVQYGDGWLPARITLVTFKKRVDYLRELCRASGKDMINIGVMPLASVAKDKQTAVSTIDIEPLIREANSHATWIRPQSGHFSTLDDISGFVIAGTPDDVIAQCLSYRAAGAGLVVFDLRLRYADWFAQIDLIGTEVLPALL